MPSRLSLLAALGVTFGVAALKLWLASHWDLLADEAYYTVWSEHLALGYFDQPPAIAWLIALARIPGDSDWGVRLPAILAGVVGAMALWPHYGDKMLGVFWWVATPPLAWLTGFITPDAPLLAAWSVTLSAGLGGGRYWLLAGAAAAAGVYAKYSALAAFPLLVVGLRAWRDPWMWRGAALLGILLLPHLGWLWTHDFVSVRFQLGEGLWHTRPPGLWGPLQVLGQQVGVLTPILALSALLFSMRRPTSRVERVAWWTSVPLVLGFFLASLAGPPEAHWPAPAWIGLGLGVSHATGRIERTAWVGIGTAALASLLLISHAQWGLFCIPLDPANRVREGRVLSDIVGVWALPDGVGWRETGAQGATPVHTERYQEAALIHWYTGLPTRKHPGCGRLDQYDLWGGVVPEQVWMVRPARSGTGICTDATHPRRIREERLDGIDRWGRNVGRWDLLQVHR